ncbi:MAG TPA: hypothetical protein VM029_00450 [Opitutaceae bacterium]|nr:hypothetical protein [Opitutaceae bacterium]
MLPFAACAAAAPAPAGGSATSGAGASPPGVVPLLAAPKWSTSLAAEASFGYKDNLLLSHAEPEKSAFVRAGVEAFVWHLPRGRTDYSAIMTAEHTRYFSGEEIDDETTAIAQLQWRYGIGDLFRFSYNLQGYYFDAVTDVSETEVQRVVAEQKITGGSTGPTLRWSPRPWGWLEVQATGKRDTFEGGFYNSKIGEGTARLGWAPVERVELSIGVTDRRRRFDHRQQVKLSGLPVDDSRLVITEREWEARLDIKWDQAARWRTSTRASRTNYRDNGSGYFNYAQERITQSLEWRDDRWRVSVDALAKRRDYEHQTVGFGLQPAARVIDDYSAALRVERKVSEKWTAFCSFRWERSRSNEVVASYRVNEGLLGARWSWEK